MKKFLIIACLALLFAPVLACARDEAEFVEEKWIYAGNDANGSFSHSVTPDGISVFFDTTSPGGGVCLISFDCEKNGDTLICQPHEGTYAVNEQILVKFAPDNTAEVSSAGSNADAHEKAYCENGGKMFGKYGKGN